MQQRVRTSSLRRGRIDRPLTYDEPPTTLFWIFLAYVLYLYLQVGYRVPLLGDLRVEFILGVILGPGAIVILRKRHTFVTGSVMRWSVSLLIVMAIMVPLSVDIAFSWDVYWNRSIKFAIFGLTIAAFVSSPRALRWFIGAWLLAFFKMGEEGFLGTITGSLIWENQETPRLHGSTPNYSHPNSFSGTQLGTAPYLLYLFPLVPWYYRVLMAIQGLFCMNVVLRTGSRTGYIALLAALGSITWTSKRRLKAIIAMIAVVVIAVPLIPAPYLERFSSIYEEKAEVGGTTSAGLRREILVDATEIFLSHPLGIGDGAFPIIRQRVFGRTQDTHNLYLEIATNLGIQGLIVFAGLIICLWVTLRRLQADMQKQVDELQKAALEGEEAKQHIMDLRFMCACARSTWLFVIIRLALGLFGMDMYEVYWWFSSGLTIALLSLNETASAKTAALLAGATPGTQAAMPQPARPGVPVGSRPSAAARGSRRASLNRRAGSSRKLPP